MRSRLGGGRAYHLRRKLPRFHFDVAHPTGAGVANLRTEMKYSPWFNNGLTHVAIFAEDAAERVRYFAHRGVRLGSGKNPRHQVFGRASRGFELNQALMPSDR